MRVRFQNDCIKTKKSRKSSIYGTSMRRDRCGETGIRTPGASQHNGFQDRRNRPLCHLSKSWTIFKILMYLSKAERQGFEPRVPRSTTVFKTAAIDHSATSPKLRYALPKHFLSKAMQRYDLFSIVQTFKKLFLIRLQIFFLHLPLCKLRRRNIRQCKAVWYQTDKLFKKFSALK